MLVKDLIDRLKEYPEDMEVVVVGDHDDEPTLSVERIAIGIDDNGDVITKHRLELT